MFAWITLLLLLLPLALLSVALETLFSTEELLEMGVSLENPCVSGGPTEGEPGNLPSGRPHAPEIYKIAKPPSRQNLISSIRFRFSLSAKKFTG
jgi:hypothetical protein